MRDDGCIAASLLKADDEKGGKEMALGDLLIFLSGGLAGAFVTFITLALFVSRKENEAFRRIDDEEFIEEMMRRRAHNLK